MKNKKKLYIPLIFAAFASLLLAIVVYGANTVTDRVDNHLQVPLIEGQLVEEFTKDQGITIGDTTGYKKTMNVKNNGTTAMFVRVMVLPEIKKEVDGSTILLPANIGAGKEIIGTLGGDWIAGEDGYYYYKKRVEAGGTTSTPIFSSNLQLASNLGDEYVDAKLTIKLKIETVSAATDDYRKVWWNTTTPPAGVLATVDTALQGQKSNT